MKRLAPLLTALCALMLAACSGRQAEPVHLLRFEQLLFEQRGHADDFRSPLINYHPDDPHYQALLADFLADPAIGYIHHVTDSLFGDLGWLERDLGQALHRARKQLPGLRYDRFYTLLTADFDNYPSRVFCNDHELAISLDRYALHAMDRYQHFGMPAYLVRLSQPQYILPDCMAAIAREHIVLPDADLTLLDYAVAEGKTLFFLEQSLPDTPDTLRLRYSKAQLDWMQKNTANVWSWMIQNKMLFSTDPSALRNLIDDAPKTNAFGEGSAPRTAAYLGWQIVRAYMKRSGATMQQLFDETDSQKILRLSAWRP